MSQALRLVLILWAAPAFVYYASTASVNFGWLWAGLNLLTLIIAVFMWEPK